MRWVGFYAKHTFSRSYYSTFVLKNAEHWIGHTNTCLRRASCIAQRNLRPIWTVFQVSLRTSALSRALCASVRYLEYGVYAPMWSRVNVPWSLATWPRWGEPSAIYAPETYTYTWLFSSCALKKVRKPVLWHLRSIYTPQYSIARGYAVWCGRMIS